MHTVTGGAGFIGSSLIESLNSQGITDILVVDNLNTSEKWKNLLGKKYANYIHKNDFIKQVENDSFSGDIDKDKIEAIIHLGACSSTTETDMDYLMRNNVEYSKTLAQLAIKNNIRFIYASSAATYGAGENGYDDEKDIESLKPLNRYGYSKQLFDLWLKNNGYLDKVCGLKFFNVYGANEHHKGSQQSVFHKAFEQIQEKGQVSLFKSTTPKYKDGDQERDFIYVKDCTKTICDLLKQKEVNGIFNLGTGKARRWNDLVKASFRALDKEPSIKYIDMPESLAKQYQNYTKAEMSKLSKSGISCNFHSLDPEKRR